MISTESVLSESFDIVVIGAGAAGLYSALCLPQSLQVGLISKESLALSASDWAQGGIAAAISSDDSPALHVTDTLQAGAGLCEVEAVTFLANHAPACIQSLVELGVTFDRHGADLALTLEAAHSKRRVLHAADTTGRAVVSVLAHQVMTRPNIQVLSPAIALDLWLEDGCCRGVRLAYRQKLYWLAAKAVVMATGGGGQVFSQTTNPALSTGDGVAMAWRAGANLRDLEFMQFHPTALTKPGAPRFLISEAVRGEGAYLFDHAQHRFAFDYHPQGELAPRDVVSRAIVSQLQKTGDPHVWLDLRSIPPDRIRHRFPNIIQVCQSWGIDVFTEAVPVSPAAHYWMGGILTNHISTSIPGLYAVGEVANTGVHGANRLASNSLLECIVFGAQLQDLPIVPGTLPPLSSPSSRKISVAPEEWQVLLDYRQQLPPLMWQSAGICRDQQSLEAAIAQVQAWQQTVANLSLTHHLARQVPDQAIDLGESDISDYQIRLWAETRNLLDIGYLILNSAGFRTESRGGHFRSDYPTTHGEWQCHTVVQNQTWQRSNPIS